MKYLKVIFTLLQETAVHYGQDKGAIAAAALAYHTVFSLAPLLVVSVALAGYVFGEVAVTGELVGQIEGVVGRETAVVIQSLIQNASLGSRGLWATIVSSVLLFLGASNVFNQLKTALNMVWGIEPAPNKGLLLVVQTRFLSILMVMGIGFLLLASVVTSTVLAALNEQLVHWFPILGGRLAVLNLGATFVLMTISFAIIFKALPDARVSWRDVLLGAVVTAIFFGLGVYLIGLYLGRSSVGSAYGAASSLVVLLFWTYMSAQILIFGAEFTRVYANKHGSQVIPKAHAVIVRRSPVLPSPVPVPLPPPVEVWETAVAPPPRHISLATGLLGLALGLFLGFVGSLLRQRD